MGFDPNLPLDHQGIDDPGNDLPDILDDFDLDDDDEDLSDIFD